MLPKATKIHEAILRELTMRDRWLEIDPTLTRVRFEVVIGRRTGMPTKVHCEVHGDTDLTVDKGNQNI